MTRFSLRFPEDQISAWYSRHVASPEEALIEEAIVPRVRRDGYLTKPDFLVICRWKTARTKSRCSGNHEEFIKAVTQVALSVPEERLRIGVLTLLDGVELPTASTLLHWLHPDPYPILDFRALWSLGFAGRPRYDFSLWVDYVTFCRGLTARNGVSVCILDRALWQYSKEKQKTSM